MLLAGFPLLVSGSRSGLLGVWSIHHGQLLQSLHANASFDPQALKAKKSKLLDSLSYSYLPLSLSLYGLVVGYLHD